MIKIAICAPFMKSDIWQERLQRAAAGYKLEFDEFYHPQDVRVTSHFRYHTCVIVMTGVYGPEFVAAARERNKDLPILWINDGNQSGLFSYDLLVTRLLESSCSNQELAASLMHCLTARKEDSYGNLA